MQLIQEENYAQEMRDLVIPYLEQRKISGDFERIPGQKIHYRMYRADAPRAELVLLHGFTEGLDKFNETVYYFLQAGFRVWQIQQRGHGKSYRGVSDFSLVYIPDYHDLIEDLHFFVTGIVKANPSDPALPLYLFGHSMGGGVSAMYLETYPADFAKAVLSSPMLELSTGDKPLWMASLFARIMIALGKGRDYMPGSTPFSPEPDFENSCSNCRPRYEYWFAQIQKRPEYQTCAPAIATSFQFLKLTRAATDPKNCSKVKTQVLLMQAGKDDVVQSGGQETFIRQIGKNGRLVRIDQAKHEIYMGRNEDLERYWKEVLDFLQ